MFKILIAEDDSELRQLFSHVLIKNGYSVTGVCNGKEALDALDKGYYDLINLRHNDAGDGRVRACKLPAHRGTASR